jgi:hypothetical protein
MGMTIDLRGIHAKLERVEECIQNLNIEVTQFLTSNPSPYRIEAGFYHTPRQYVFKVTLTTEIPLRFSVLAGEVVHHLRSCLDHLIVALAKHNGQRPLNTHQFPICRKREKFKKACGGGQIKGISKRAFRRIVQAQPYRSADPNLTALNILHYLDNMDKHARLLLCAQAVQLGGTIRIVAASRPIVVSGMWPPIPRVATEQGIEVFGIDLGEADPEFQADVDFAFQISAPDIGAGQIVPIIPLLVELDRETRRIVGLLASAA